MNDKCSAGIVLFNPDILRLRHSIESIINQVESLILVDNGSNNIKEIEKLIEKYNTIKLIKSSSNKGIAFALNIIVKESKMQGYEWVLTLDQDSVTQKNTIKIFEKYINNNDVAIICPYIIDKTRKNIQIYTSDEEITEVKFCITSGSLINIDICTKIGGFDEWMFIGLVDNDYCRRIDILKYKILQVNSIILDHQLGDLVPSRFEKLYLNLSLLLKMDLIGKLSYKRKINPDRLYYGTRNVIYMMKKYKLYDNKLNYIIFLVKNSIFSLIRGKNKLILLNKIKNGISDGCKTNVKYFKK